MHRGILVSSVGNKRKRLDKEQNSSYFDIKTFLKTQVNNQITPAVVNYYWQIWQQLTTADSSALKFSSSIVILCVSIEKIKKIDTYSEWYRNLNIIYCIFIEVSVKFRSIQTNSRFILIFRPNRVKSQFFRSASPKMWPT